MKISDQKIINAVFNVFETKIERNGKDFVVVDKSQRNDSLLLKHIDEYIIFLNKRYQSN